MRTKRQATTELGNRILFVVDCRQNCMQMLRNALADIPDIASKRFTLIRCVPPALWEHSGNPTGNEAIWEHTDKEFRQTDDYFANCTELLQSLNVPAANIRQVVSTETRTTADAVVRELQENFYTGVLVGQCHSETIDRIQGRGLLNALRRHKPDVAVRVLR